MCEQCSQQKEQVADQSEGSLCDAADSQLRQLRETWFQHNVDHPLNRSSVHLPKPKWAETVTEVAEEQDKDCKGEVEELQLQK